MSRHDAPEVRGAVLALLVAIYAMHIVFAAQKSGSSPTCHQIEGKTPTDYERVVKFCSAAIPQALDVQGVIAMDSLMWIKIGRPLANVMLRDRLTTEQIVKNWMKAWRSLTNGQVVTVTVQWQDVDIAVGDTTLFGGDRVTIKQ